MSRKAHLVSHHHDERLVLHQLETKDRHLDFQREVSAGLSQSPKTIPPKFFYDQRGSELFEEITQTPEYYPTRTEATILEANRDQILDAVGQEISLVELGSGSSTKTRYLLDGLTERQGPLEYIPIDISPTIVAENGKKLLEDYPELQVSGLICDYHRAMDALSESHLTPRLFLFLGSSLGNFEPKEGVELLRSIRGAMKPHDRLLLGVDLVKPVEILEPAYNDAAGVTAAFNLNVLAHINHALGGHFDLDLFLHRAFFNTPKSRVEMHLVSRESQIIPIDALGQRFSFLKGETIHTENSHKFTLNSLDIMCAMAGLSREANWMDEHSWFVLTLLKGR